MKHPIVEKVAIVDRRCASCQDWIREGDSYFAPLRKPGPARCVHCHETNWLAGEVRP